LKPGFSTILANIGKLNGFQDWDAATTSAMSCQSFWKRWSSNLDPLWSQVV
jgi:hypothetical protein